MPRWSRSPLARSSCPRVLLAAAVFTAACVCGGAGAQQLNDTDSSLLAPALDGNPRSPPRFQAAPKKPKKDEGESLGLAQAPSFGSAPASGAGSTGFDSSNGGPRKLQSKSGARAKPVGFSGGGVGSRGSDGAKGSAKKNGTSNTKQSRANQGNNGGATSPADATSAPALVGKPAAEPAAQPVATRRPSFEPRRRNGHRCDGSPQLASAHRSEAFRSIGRAGRSVQFSSRH